MSNRYLVRDDWRYSEVSPGAIYESHVGAVLARNLEVVFPEYRGWRMEPLFRTYGGDVRPDLILIRRDLSTWGIVEVEVSGHSVRSHILPQLNKLRIAAADEKLIRDIHSKLNNEYTLNEVSECLSRQPKVYLVVHGDSTSYVNEIDSLGVEAIDIEIHQGTDKANDYIIRVHDRTSTLTDLGLIARRAHQPNMRYLWAIEDVQIDRVHDGSGQVEVLFSGTRSIWKVLPAGKDVILRQPTDLSVPEGILVAKVLMDEESKSLHLIPITKG